MPDANLPRLVLVATALRKMTDGQRATLLLADRFGCGVVTSPETGRALVELGMARATAQDEADWTIEITNAGQDAATIINPENRD